MSEGKNIFIRQAISDAIEEEMDRDPNVFMLGEDIGKFGGAFAVTKKLYKKFGEDRIIDTPICEASFTGLAIGAAMHGMRPIVEIMYIDWITLAMDQLINIATKMYYCSNKQFNVPMVLRTQMGTKYGNGYGSIHSQCLESWFLNVPGLKVVAPSTARDTKGLMKTSIRDNNPTLFLEHKMLYGMVGPVPEDEDFAIPFGQADIKRKGNDITLVSYSKMLHECLEAASAMEKEGVSVEVVDLRTLAPMDTETLIKSASKTKNVVVVEEGVKEGGVGAEVGMKIVEKLPSTKISRVGALKMPIPYAPILEQNVVPNAKTIENKIKEALSPCTKSY